MVVQQGDTMFNFNPFKIPTYSEYKEQVAKFFNDVTSFYKEWYSDVEKCLKK